MRYLKGHKMRTRDRILENASCALRLNGADGTSVVDFMKLAGLTHGGFYLHFESREALVIDAFALAMDRKTTNWVNLFKALPIDRRFDVVVEEYLSPSHRDDPARGCVLPALGTDIARLSLKARRVFTNKLEEMIGVVAQLFPEKTANERRQIATGALATLMGSIILARAVGDKKLSDQILGAGRRALCDQSAGRRAKIAPRGRRENNKTEG